MIEKRIKSIDGLPCPVTTFNDGTRLPDRSRAMAVQFEEKRAEIETESESGVGLTSLRIARNSRTVLEVD